MPRKKKATLAVSKFVEGPVANVWLTPNARESIDNLSSADRRTRARLNALLKRYSEHGHEIFQKQAFDFQERIDGIGIYRFRSHDLRLYGTLATYRNARSFIGAEVDESKKKNKADRNKLKSAAAKCKSVLSQEE